jgi:hypothetical protein
MGDWSWTLGKHNEPAKQPRSSLDAGLLLQVGESSLLSAAHLALLSALAPLTRVCGTPRAASAGTCSGRTRSRRWSSSATEAVLRHVPQRPEGKRAKLLLTLTGGLSAAVG